MEVTARARTDERDFQLRRLLLRFELHAFDSTIDFDAAATIYRRRRQEGITPRDFSAA